MGGKIKQSQRTKNNVRPSSSGRSALLLSNVKFESGVGFGGSEPAVFPTVVVPTIDPAVSPELQICIKKLNKKDPITKTKALQELTELVANSNVDDVVAILPSWAHFYKLLSADSDRKVREATQVCHGRVMGAVGRRAAPVLRRVVPAWLQAQHDDHGPAAARAAASLANTFPDKKLPEVIAYCKEEVMTHLIDNIIGNGEAAYIKKTDSREEAGATSARVSASSLHGVQFVCRHLHAAHAAWLWDRLAPLLQHKAMWNKAKHTDDTVRAAWYAAMGGMRAAFGEQFAASHGNRMLRVMLAARETAPYVAAHYWDALLLFIYNIQNWPKYLDNTDLLSKRIIDLLENGGWGEARRLGALLLPLLAHLPPHLRGQDFLRDFFHALFQGLEKKSILTSKSERQSWVTSVAECVRYVSTQQQSHTAETVSAALRHWLLAVLAARDVATRNHLVRHSADTMAAMIEYWLRQAQADERYDHLVRNFWQNVRSTLTGQIDKMTTDPREIATTIDGHALLLRTLRTGFAREPTRRRGIKFDDDVAAESPPSPASPAEECVPCDPSVRDRYEHNLSDVAHAVCARYFVWASECEMSEPVLAPLVTLLQEFDSAELYARAADHFACDSLHAWYDRVLRGWLAGDTMRSRSLVDVVFLLLPHLAEEHQDALFDTFTQFPGSVLEWCVCVCMSAAHGARASVRRWLVSRVVADTLRAVCVRLLARGDAPAGELLLLCLRPGTHGELPVSAEAAGGAVSQLCGGVRAAPAPGADGAAPCDGAAREACAAVCAAVCAAAPSPAAREELAMALFTLSMPFPWNSVCSDTREECRAAWQDALLAFEPERRERFVRHAVDTIHEHLALGSERLVLASEMSQALSVCPYLVCDTQQLSDVPHLTAAVLAPLGQQPGAVETCALLHDVTTGQLSCPLETCPLLRDVTAPLLESHVISYGNSVVLKAVFVHTMVTHATEGGRWCDVTVQHAAVTRCLCDVLHDYTVLRSLHDGCATWPHYELIEQSKTTTEKLIEAIVHQCSTESKRHIQEALTRLAVQHGYYWAYASKYFYNIEHNVVHTDKQHEHSERSEIDNINDNKLESDQSDIKHNESDKVENTQNESREYDNSSETDSKNISVQSQGKGESGASASEECVSGESECKECEADYVEDFNVDKINEIVATDGYFHMLQASVRGAAESECLRARYITMLRGLYVSHRHDAQATGARFVADACRGQARCDADLIVNAYYAANHVMLLDTDVSGSGWAAVSCNAAVAHYLTALVAARGWSLPQHHWDFTNITLCSLLTSVNMSRENWSSVSVSSLCVSVLRLHDVVRGFVRGVPGECTRRQPAAHVARLPREWADVFAADTDYNILSLALYLLESAVSESVSAAQAGVVQQLVRSLAHVRWAGLGAARCREVSLERAHGAACAALQPRAHHAYKLLACALLHALCEPLVLDDAERVAAGGGGSARLWPARYRDTWERLRDPVCAALQDVRVGEGCCEPAAGSEVRGAAASWLLLARVLDRHYGLARGDLVHRYIRLHRDLGYNEPLLACALRLLPEDVLAFAAAGGPPPPALHLFDDDDPPPDLYARADGRAVQRLACGAVRRCVRGCGAADTRGWRAAAPPRAARALDALVCAYIAPRAIDEELGALQRRAHELEDAEVFVQRSALEATLVLTLEERPLRLRVRLAREHPLRPPRLEPAPDAPAADTHWLHVYMTHQNGSVLNALKMWTASVSRRVERAAPCYVCYCRLHYASGALPAAHCRQCRNTFHTACLNKWFKSSGKSNCPICRGPF